jgi:hypothetical protein
MAPSGSTGSRKYDTAAGMPQPCRRSNGPYRSTVIRNKTIIRFGNRFINH